MKKTSFTENQKKAHDFSRHISVTANAGSGKTMVLTNRYLNILLNTDTNIEELVAITFTEKAAGELKNRIAQSIDNIISTTTDKNLKAKCQKIRERIASANISTIHSFCAKILRLNPVEANVDVAFTILEGVDKKILIDESINETFSNILKNPDTQFSQELINLLRTLSKRDLINLINYFIEKREQLERLISENGLYQKSDEEILQFWNESIINFIINILNPQTFLALVQSTYIPDQTLKNELINKIQLITACTNLKDQQKLLIELNELASIISKLRVKKVEDHNNNFSLLKQKCDEFKDIFYEFGNLEQNIKILNYSRTILKLYKAILANYEQKKFEKSYLDYDDLQLKTKELLKNSDVRNYLSNKFKYIMIDEYQDTNFLQYEIFLPLLDELKKGNLFIVGDPKQSIFGFRNAEVEVFERTKKDILNNSINKNNLCFYGEFLESTEEEKRGQIILAENFRLLTDIIAFVNLTFQKLFGNVEHEFDVRYQELIKGRNNPESGKVELMLNIVNDTKSDQEDESSSDQDKECEMIARRLIKLKQENYTVYETSRTNFEENPHAFDFGDAAILLRSRTYLKKLEYWLNKYKVPYVISGGIGFYQTQEIYDFYNYFQFLLNNKDDVALVGILRSPFFGISDSELYEIAIRYDEDIDFWSKVKKFSTTDNATSYLKRAVNILSQNICYAARVPIPMLVHNIFKQTGWIGAISGIQRGEQSKLNIKKLLNIAREFEGKGFTNLYDFVERLKTLIEKEEREGQANISSGIKAVQIMTIHAAKGLEFPVVFIPFLNKPLKLDNGPFVDTKFGIGFKVRENDEKSSGTSIFNFLKYRSNLRSLAEEKRLLYVACTRARDLLVLSGTLKNTSKRSYYSFLKWIMKSLEINQPELKEVVFPKQKIKSIVLKNGSFVTEEFDHDLKISIINSLDDLTISNNLQFESYPPEKIDQVLIQNIPAHLKNNFYSATQIQTFNTCAMKYFLKYQLGIPEIENRIYTYHEDAEPDDKLYSEQIGLGVHKVLEKFTDYSENEVKDFLYKFLPIELFNNPNEFEKTLEIILKHIQNYFNSDIQKEISIYKNYKNEFTISSKFGEDFITGTMDKIFLNSQNKWVIVDYKTDRIAGKSIEQLAKKYIHQISFYALLINRMFNQNHVEAIVIFTEKAKENYYKFYFDANDIKIVENSINETIKKISSGDITKNTEACEYCGFQNNGKCIGDRISMFR